MIKKIKLGLNISGKKKMSWNKPDKLDMAFKKSRVKIKLGLK